MLKTLILAATIIALPLSSAVAQDAFVRPPEGTTVINLSATERLSMDQDLLQASLRFEVDGAKPADVQKKINDTVKKALEDAKKQSAIKVSTGQYYVYSYDPNPTPPPTDPKKTEDASQKQIWRGSQSIELESKSADVLLELVGRIQAMGFSVNGLAYTLSPEKREGVSDELMTKALNRLKARADVAAKALGKTSYELLEVNVDTSMPYAQPMMMKGARMEMASDAAGSAPTADPGETEVSLSVTGRILLK